MLSPAVSPHHRYVVLDSLRGICACLIVLMHFDANGYVSQLPFVRNAFLCVDFFFVLSGFVIGSSYGERLTAGFSVGRFMALRLGRIYPLHVAVLLMFVLFEACLALVPALAQRGAFADPFSVMTLIQSLLLIQIFAGPDISAWNLPSWSIAAEIWTYLIFAGLLRWVPRLTIPFSIVAAVAAPIFLAVQSDRYMNVLHDGALVRCIFGFGLGVIGWRLAQWVLSISLPQWADHAFELGTVAAIILFVSLAGAGPFSVGAPFLFLAAVLIFARERGCISACLRTAPFVLIGGLSYSIYMIHTFLQFRLTNAATLVGKVSGLPIVETADGHSSFAASGFLADAISLFFLALVILFAYGTYRLIERPAQRISRKWISGTRASG